MVVVTFLKSVVATEYINLVVSDADPDWSILVSFVASPPNHVRVSSNLIVEFISGIEVPLLACSVFPLNTLLVLILPVEFVPAAIVTGKLI